MSSLFIVHSCASFSPRLGERGGDAIGLVDGNFEGDEGHGLQEIVEVKGHDVSSVDVPAAPALGADAVVRRFHGFGHNTGFAGANLSRSFHLRVGRGSMATAT